MSKGTPTVTIPFMCLIVACAEEGYTADSEHEEEPGAAFIEREAGDEEMLRIARERGRALSELFYDQGFEKLWHSLTLDAQEGFGDESSFRARCKKIHVTLGAEVDFWFDRPGISIQPQGYVYERRAFVEKCEAPVVMTWRFNDEGSVTRFEVMQLYSESVSVAASNFLSYKTKTPLRVPFHGEWYVLFGGRSGLQNHHATEPDLRFAYDLVVKRNGSLHEGDGNRNEEFYGFGQPIFAPGPGIVITAVNDIEDNEPDLNYSELIETKTDQRLGNHVIIDHQNGEYSFLAHFRRGSIIVKEGDEVGAGDLLGECGNSGLSTGPHLHYHLQNTPDPGLGEGLPAQFRNYIANGEVVERGEPERAQVLRARIESKEGYER